MRSRYLLGFAALGIAGVAEAQAPTGRGVPPRDVHPAVTNRVTIPTPLAPGGTATPTGFAPGVPTPAAAQPAVARPAAEVQPAVFDDMWAAPGTVRPRPAQLPPPTVTQIRYEDTQPPAKLPEVAPPPARPMETPKSAPAAAPTAAAPTMLAFPPMPTVAALTNGATVPCPTPAAAFPPVRREPERPCGPVGCGWVRGEWLYWATRGQNLPPLATTSPLGTAPDLARRLSTPASVVLYGGEKVNEDFRNGFRLSGGYWLDEGGKWGIDADFFFLGRSRDGFAAAADANGSPILARPFFNAIFGVADAGLVSYPGVGFGATTVDARTSPLIGGGVNLTRNLCCDPCGRLDAIAGYRYVGFTDEVTIANDSTALAAGPAGARFQVTDRFRTENHFHGGVIGLSGEYKYGFLYTSARVSVALGGVTQTTEIGGSTTITPQGGTPTTFAGGLLAQPSNIGRYEETRFAVMPEVSMRTGVYVTSHCRAYVGYNYLYLSSVARAGDQIDARVNTTQILSQGVGAGILGPRVPAYLGATTGFWAQGVMVGLQVDF